MRRLPLLENMTAQEAVISKFPKRDLEKRLKEMYQGEEISFSKAYWSTENVPDGAHLFFIGKENDEFLKGDGNIVGYFYPARKLAWNYVSDSESLEVPEGNGVYVLLPKKDVKYINKQLAQIKK
jgi:hypothetical protein